MTLQKETRKSLVNKKFKKLNKVLYTMLLCILLLGIMSASAGAEDDDYNFDVFGQNTTDSTVKIYADCKYDPDNESYTYAVEGIASEVISSSVLSETYTNESVWVNAIGGVDYTVYKDGLEYKKSDDGTFSEPGEYAITVYDNKGQKKVILRFTILARIVNSSRLVFPKTCNIEYVNLNGAPIKKNNFSIELLEEGDYEIGYKVVASNKHETISIKVDRTAPTLKFKGLNSKNEAKGPVELKKIEKKCSVSIVKDGKKLEYRKKLLDSGKYEVTIKDEAGNQTVYEFVILPYFNFSSLVFFILCAAVIAGICAYIVLVRRNLRVR